MTIRGDESVVAGVRSDAGEHPALAASRPIPVWIAAVAIVVVGGVLPLVVANHFGALGIPRNDDWSYLRSAFRFADHGTVDGNGWASMNLVGQLVLAAPVVLVFGHRITALQIEVSILGVFGLLAVFDLGKRLVTAPRALFVALLVAVGPLWANLSTTFMTDVPAFALAMIALALGARAFHDEDLDLRFYSFALLVGFAAFTVREYAIVAPFAVALASVWICAQRIRSRVKLTASALVVLLVAATAFFVWRRGLPGFHDLSPVHPDPSSLRSAFQLACQAGVLFGVLVAPAVLLARPRQLIRASWVRAPRTTAVLTLVTLVALAAESMRHWSSAAFLGPGDYVMPTGALDTFTVSGTRPDLLPKVVWIALAIIGIATMVVVVLAAVPPILDALAAVVHGHLPSPGSPALAVVGLATVGFGAAFVLPSAFRIVTFDRYLLPLVPLVGILLLRAAPSAGQERLRSKAWAGAALAALALLGLVFAANSASFDGKKWKVADEVTTAAGGPSQVEGGFEWDDAHAGREVYLGKKPEQRPLGHFCVVLLSEDHDPHGPEILRTARVWAPPGADTWIVARRRPC